MIISFGSFLQKVITNHQLSCHNAKFNFQNDDVFNFPLTF